MRGHTGSGPWGLHEQVAAAGFDAAFPVGRACGAATSWAYGPLIAYTEICKHCIHALNRGTSPLVGQMEGLMMSQLEGDGEEGGWGIVVSACGDPISSCEL